MRKSTILLEPKVASVVAPVLLQNNGLDVKEVDVTPYQANCLPLPKLNEVATYLGTGTLENRRDLKSEADDLMISLCVGLGLSRKIFLLGVFYDFTFR